MFYIWKCFIYILSHATTLIIFLGISQSSIPEFFAVFPFSVYIINVIWLPQPYGVEDSSHICIYTHLPPIENHGVFTFLVSIQVPKQAQCVSMSESDQPFPPSKLSISHIRTPWGLEAPGEMAEMEVSRYPLISFPDCYLESFVTSHPNTRSSC
jgi:hypothetical protein